MGTRKSKTVRISRDCEEISAHNFFKLRDTGDLQWICPDFEGYGQVKLPEDADAKASEILEEYAKLTKNDKTLDYIENVRDLEKAVTRILGASIMLDAIDKRWYMMSEETQNSYAERLGRWNFILNRSKPMDQELQRLYRQLRAAKTKVKRLEASKDQMEKGFSKKNIDIVEVLVQVKNILKRDIDLKKISIKEWHYTVSSIPKKKAA